MSNIEKAVTIFVTGIIVITVLRVAFTDKNTAGVINAAGDSTSHVLQAASA